MPTSTIASRTGRWTYADYCRIPPDRLRHEIIDGRHFVNPAPSPHHQRVSGRLQFELMRELEQTGQATVLAAPIDVHLARRVLVQPDLVVVLAGSPCTIGPKKLRGAPDLIVEILSPNRRAYDRRIKRGRYERSGVREYWIVDPDQQCVEQLVLQGGRYVLIEVARRTIRPRILRGVTIDLTGVW
jgi:Uma2 family endonuclease